jgi:signal transduction histidine kinase
VSLQIAAPAIDTHCHVDPLRLEQVFRNILENALAACSDPAVINVRFANATGADGKAMEISIHDNGPGMNTEQCERIFQPFFTTKSRGCGLGMAITRRIVEAHGGQVSVAPSSKSGTEILITIPRGAP